MDLVKDFVPDSPIVIELNTDQCFTATFLLYNKDGKYIQVKNVFETISGKKIKGAQNFYESEIISIRALKTNCPNSSVQSIQEDSEHTTSISSLELESIKGQIENSVYIWQCDHTFYNAINDLKHQEFIGVNVIGSKFGRTKPVSLISFSTTQKIYHFDMCSLGKLFSEIKEIFEHPLPRKIVYNSCYIADYLKHRESCELNGVFDILVAHFLIRKQKEIISLKTCLSLYLNLPESYLNIPEIDWSLRPLDSQHKAFASCQVAFLIKLYLYMAHDILLRPLNQMSTKYSKVYASNEDGVDVLHKMITNKNPGIIDINENALNDFLLADLPAE